MKKHLVYILCESGLTSSIMLNKLNDIISEESYNIKIEAVPVALAEEKICDHIPSVILLTPQVKFLKQKFLMMYQDRGVIVEVIPKKIYASLDARHIIKILSDLLEL